MFNRLYAIFGNSTDRRYYDINKNVRSWALTALPIAPSLWGCLKSVWQYIYYFPANGWSRRRYRYDKIAWTRTEASLVGTWVAVGSWGDILPSSPLMSSQAKIIWPEWLDADRLYLVPWASTKRIIELKISNVSYVGLHEFKCVWDLYGSWSISDYVKETNELFRVPTASRNILKTKLNLWAQITGTVWTVPSWVNPNNTLTKVWNIVENWITKTGMQALFEDNVYAQEFYITKIKTGAVRETRRIVANNEETFTVDSNWTVNPAYWDTFEIKATVLDYGAVSSSTANTITDSSKNNIWMTNSERYSKIKTYNASWVLVDERFVTANTSAWVLTVDANRSVNPSAWWTYEIIWMKTMPECYIPAWTSASYPWDTMESFIQNWVITIYAYRKNWQSDRWYFYSMTP